MAVNLVKGQRVDLKKHDGTSLKRVMVGLGWDEVERPRRLFAAKPADIDCDASVFLCANGRLQDNGDIVYFGNLAHRSGAVQHMGDNLTGAGEGDDEQILVEIARVPAQYDRLVFVVNIYQAQQRRQHFGLIRNAFIRVVDGETNRELCRYNLTEDYDGYTALICGEIYRHGGDWKFNAVGQPTNDGSIGDLAKRYR